jgi:hypothetical protein
MKKRQKPYWWVFLHHFSCRSKEDF